MEFLNKNDAYMVCANDEVDTTNANGKLLTRLLISVSQNEIERTSERIKFGMSGAIKAVLRILEGDFDAFRRRTEVYGFELIESHLIENNIFQT